MRSSENKKRKPFEEKNLNSIPTKTIRLPLPLVNKLLDLKKKKGLDFLYRADVAEIFSLKHPQLYASFLFLNPGCKLDLRLLQMS